MRKLCSWRLSRLLDVSAWKRLESHPLWILVLFVCVTFLFCAYGAEDEAQERFLPLIWLSAAMFVYIFIDTVLGADEYCQIRLKTTCCNVYIYNRKSKYDTWVDIIFLQDDTEAHIATTNTVLNEEGYHFYNGSFRYCLDGDNNKWYHLGRSSDEPQFLGKKLESGACNVYLGEPDKDNTLHLCVLHKTTIMHLWADSFVLGNAYVPPLARQNILYRYRFVSWQPIEEAVHEYLIIRKDGQYKVYGLYCFYMQTPRCVELSVSSIIFQEMRERVILIQENETYKEVCRKFAATRWVDDIIAELSSSYAGTGFIGGIVWKFDEKTKQLQKLYEGRYRALGFADGSIVGDNWEYMPNPDEGTEYKVA